MNPSWKRQPIPETASLGVRIAAFTVDFLVATGVFVLLAVIALLGSGVTLGGVGTDPAVVLPVLTFYLPSLLLYFTIGEAWTGATLGKRLLGLRTLRADGTPLSWFDSFIRNVLRFLWFVPPIWTIFLLVDIYLIHRGELDQRIGDLGAQTVVVPS